jgi:hypothetical protein
MPIARPLCPSREITSGSRARVLRDGRVVLAAPAAASQPEPAEHQDDDDD